MAVRMSDGHDDGPSVSTELLSLSYGNTKKTSPPKKNPSSHLHKRMSGIRLAASRAVGGRGGVGGVSVGQGSSEWVRV